MRKRNMSLSNTKATEQLSKSKRIKNGVLLLLCIFITFLQLIFLFLIFFLFFKCYNWCYNGSAIPNPLVCPEDGQAQAVEGVLLPRAHLPDGALLPQAQGHGGLPDRVHAHLLLGQAVLQLQGPQQVCHSQETLNQEIGGGLAEISRCFAVSMTMT